MKYSPMAQPEYGAMKESAAGSDAPATTTIVCSIAPVLFEFGHNARHF